MKPGKRGGASDWPKWGIDPLLSVTARLSPPSKRIGVATREGDWWYESGPSRKLGIQDAGGFEDAKMPTPQPLAAESAGHQPRQTSQTVTVNTNEVVQGGESSRSLSSLLGKAGKAAIFDIRKLKCYKLGETPGRQDQDELMQELRKIMKLHFSPLHRDETLATLVEHPRLYKEVVENWSAFVESPCASQQQHPGTTAAAADQMLPREPNPASYNSISQWPQSAQSRQKEVYGSGHGAGAVVPSSSAVNQLQRPGQVAIGIGSRPSGPSRLPTIRPGVPFYPKRVSFEADNFGLPGQVGSFMALLQTSTSGMHSHLYVCHPCGAPSANKEDIIMHFFNTHRHEIMFEPNPNYVPVPPPTPAPVATTSAATITMFEAKIGQSPNECRTCGLRFMDPSAAEEHNKSHNGVYTCLPCKKVFSQKELLKKHMFSDPAAHKYDMYQCHVCNDKFNTRPKLLKHLDIKHQVKPVEYSCGDCSRTYKTERGLTAHLKYPHPHEIKVKVEPEQAEDHQNGHARATTGTGKAPKISEIAGTRGQLQLVNKIKVEPPEQAAVVLDEEAEIPLDVNCVPAAAAVNITDTADTMAETDAGGDDEAVQRQRQGEGGSDVAAAIAEVAASIDKWQEQLNELNEEVNVFIDFGAPESANAYEVQAQSVQDFDMDLFPEVEKTRGEAQA